MCRVVLLLVATNLLGCELGVDPAPGDAATVVRMDGDGAPGADLGRLRDLAPAAPDLTPLADLAPPRDLTTLPDLSVALSDLRIEALGVHEFTVHFVTRPALAADVSVELWPDRPGAPPVATRTGGATVTHDVLVDHLFAAADYRVIVHAGGAQAAMTARTLDPPWPATTCRGGAPGIPVDETGGWTVYADNGGTLLVTAAAGCGALGGAARFEFDLGAGEWVVASRAIAGAPVDLRAATHLRIPLRGDPANPAVAVEVKLKDGQGGLGVVRLDGGSRLPVFRDWIVDLREFRPQTPSPPDLSDVRAIEVGFSQPRGQHLKGSLLVDDLAALDVTAAVAPVAGFERVPYDEAVLASIAGDLHARSNVYPDGFVPAWFEEATPNWNLYANAMVLIVLALEHRRTGDAAFAVAARTIADELVALQNLAARGGALDDSYERVQGALGLRAAPDRVLWVGSTAWAGIALIVAHDALASADWDDAIRSIAGFYLALLACREAAGLPRGSVTEGTEGNVSSFLFLDAAARRQLADPTLADRVAQFIETELFDASQQRLVCGVEVDLQGFDPAACLPFGGGAILRPVATSCLDVIANWGTAFHLRRHRPADALAGLAYAREVFPVRSFDDQVRGLGDIAGPWAPTVEFGAGQWAAAGGPDAAFILGEAIARLCDPGGTCRGASDDFAAGIGWNTRWHGIAPAAWVYLAIYGRFWDEL